MTRAKGIETSLLWAKYALDKTFFHVSTPRIGGCVDHKLQDLESDSMDYRILSFSQLTIPDTNFDHLLSLEITQMEKREEEGILDKLNKR